jgi:hypothetical protein
MDSSVSVYVDRAAGGDAVRAAVAGMPTPENVKNIAVYERSVTLGCRVAVNLTGDFTDQIEGRIVARQYASQLSSAIGMPVFPVYGPVLSTCPARLLRC